MSDYYEFQCPVCEELGGFFSRQMWGWGNCDIVETFRFITYHVSNCRARSFNIIWEQDDVALTALRGIDHITDWDAFPHSNDWETQQSYGTGDGPLHSWWTDRLIADGYVKRAKDHNDRVQEEDA